MQSGYLQKETFVGVTKAEELQSQQGSLNPNYERLQVLIILRIPIVNILDWGGFVWHASPCLDRYLPVRLSDTALRLDNGDRHLRGEGDDILKLVDGIQAVLNLSL